MGRKHSQPAPPPNPQQCSGPILIPGCRYDGGSAATGDYVQYLSAGPYMFDGKVYGLTPDICPSFGGTWEPDNKCLVNITENLCARYHGIWDPANGGACGVSYEQLQADARGSIDKLAGRGINYNHLHDGIGASSGKLAVRGLTYEPPMDALTLGLYINLILCIGFLAAFLSAACAKLMKGRRKNREGSQSAGNISRCEHCKVTGNEKSDDLV